MECAGEVPQRSPEGQWHWSRSLALSSAWPDAAACTCSGRELGVVQAGISLLGSESWLTRWCIYLYKSKSVFRFWVLSDRVIEANTIMIPRWNHNGICTGKWNGNKNSRNLDFTQTGTCIISFSAYLIITGPFYKVLQHLFKLPHMFLSLCILRKSISILVLVILQLLWK